MSGHLYSSIDSFFIELPSKRGQDGAQMVVDSHTYAINRIGEISRALPRSGSLSPTKYVLGVLKWLIKQPKFQFYTRSCVMSVEEKGLLSEKVNVGTESVPSITCLNSVEATCVPLKKLSLVAELEFFRTYCIAIRVPKGSIEDCLLYNSKDPYRYVRFTAHDENDDFLIIGGNDHKVGHEFEDGGRYAELESWVRAYFTQAGAVDYRWSGQIFEPVDCTAFICKSQGQSHVYICTGDFGNGLTHGVIAGKVIADEIMELEKE